jgi:hypothetical protein
MTKSEIRSELTREPFIPIRLHLKNGKKVLVPFAGVARVLHDDILVFKGLKQGTHRATGYFTFDFEDVVRIEQLKTGSGGQRRRKAS